MDLQPFLPNFPSCRKVRKIIEKQDPAWVIPENRRKTGPCLSRAGFSINSECPNVKNEKNVSMGNSRKQDPAWVVPDFHKFVEICSNSGFHKFVEICRNSCIYFCAMFRIPNAQIGLCARLWNASSIRAISLPCTVLCTYTTWYSLPVVSNYT